MTDFRERLNNLYERLVSDEFLTGKGRSGEVPFYIFDYPPEKEIVVRDHLENLTKKINAKSNLNAKHINLFELLIEHLSQRNILDKALEESKKKGDDFLLKALRSPLSGEKFAKVFFNKCDFENQDMFLLSGVGSVFPMIRTHNLLNNLQPLMKEKPLILFFPGVYDNKTLKLFGEKELLAEDNYYRAFRL